MSIEWCWVGVAWLLRDGQPEKACRAGMQALATRLRGLRGTPTSVTFAADDPLRVHFSDQKFTVAAHIACMQLEGTALPGLRLQASYRIVTPAVASPWSASQDSMSFANRTRHG